MKEIRRIAILQPEIPHYRTEFFDLLREKVDGLDLFTYSSEKMVEKLGFCVGLESIHISNIEKKGFLIYAPWKLLSKRYDTLVLMLHFAHVTTWLLLLTKWLHRKKIILWGQGISVKRYLKESKKLDWKLKWQIALADGVWIYEEPEAKQWQAIFPKKPIVALNNTLSGVEEMLRTGELDETEQSSYETRSYENDTLHYDTEQSSYETRSMLRYENGSWKESLKRKWGIEQEVVLIFCARFENNYRRTDLLVETIERLDSQKYGFIIIGEGKNKPNFKKHGNVYDFGAVYDNEKKCELFTVADIYFQPGWVGLSIVEAMAYGKPIFTFRRSEETLQCVEYCYIEEGKNGLIFDNMDDCIHQINTLSKEQILQMGENARQLVKEKLTPRQMVENACSIL